MEPLTGRPAQVLPKLEKLISKVIKQSKVVEFYIGRSVLPESRGHSTDETLRIYATNSVDYALEVEDWLIKRFYKHSKNNNEAKHSGGGYSADYINYVYLALWHD